MFRVAAVRTHKKIGSWNQERERIERKSERRDGVERWETGAFGKDRVKKMKGKVCQSLKFIRVCWVFEKFINLNRLLVKKKKNFEKQPPTCLEKLLCGIRDF